MLKLREGLLAGLALGDLEGVEPDRLAQRSALAHGNGIPDLKHTSPVLLNPNQRTTGT